MREHPGPDDKHFCPCHNYSTLPFVKVAIDNMQKNKCDCDPKNFIYKKTGCCPCAMLL